MRPQSGVIAVYGVLCCSLMACGGGKDSTRPETPIATSISLQPTGAGAELDALGATLQLTATVRDQSGNPMSASAVVYSSAHSDVATVSSTGLVTALGNGTSTITAKAGAAAGDVSIVVAQKESDLTIVSGDLQAGVGGSALAEPLVVQVSDRLGHPVAAIPVAFHVAGGSGSVSTDSVATDATGRAQTIWTTSAAVGEQRLHAVVAGLDSVRFSATVVDSAGANSPLLVAPDTLVESAVIALTGGTFSATPTNNVVSIDGVAATVSAATVSSLTVVVPTYSCRPSRMVTVSVQTAGLPARSVDAPLRPAAYTSLAIGEETIVQDPSKFCFQFPATDSSALEVYVMGLSTPAEVPNAVLPFKITTRTGSSVPGSVSAPLPLATAQSGPLLPARRLLSGMPLGRTGGPRPGTPSPQMAEKAGAMAAMRSRSDAMRGRQRAELQVRMWEASHLPVLVASSRARGRSTAGMMAPAGALTTPSLGDTLTLRVANFGATNPCTEYTTIKAVVRVIGNVGIWVQDVGNPTNDSLTLADIQSASNQFDSRIYATDTLNFGHPSDIDNNGRVIVALTKEVNKHQNLLGFVFAGDLFPDPSLCPQSNGSEIYYGEVPDPTNALGTGARTRADVLSRMPRVIAHEFTHIIQFSQRLVINNGTLMALWEMEGQATLAEELVGHSVLGNSSGQNYGWSTAFGAGSSDWYGDEIVKLMSYFGFLGAGNQAANAPDLCTVYGSLQLTSIPCDVSAFYGASWILQRYISDQYGPIYPGGEAQLTRDWVSGNLSKSGTANIQALLGVDYDQLFVRFATALALDDVSNLSGAAWVPPEFSITSWNTADIAEYVSECCHVGWLTAQAIGFAQGSSSRSVRGGSTAYSVIGSSSGHAGTAFQVTDPSGNALGTELRPALWIVRVQ